MTGPKAFLTYASSVQLGAQSGIQECKHQFAWERWNCPENTLQLSTHSGLRRGKTLKKEQGTGVIFSLVNMNDNLEDEGAAFLSFHYVLTLRTVHAPDYYRQQFERRLQMVTSGLCFSRHKGNVIRPRNQRGRSHARAYQKL